MPPTSKFGRRKFFAGAIAFVAALLTPRPKASAALVTKGWAEPPQMGQAYTYFEKGHQFYIWPEVPPAPMPAFFVDAEGNVFEFSGCGRINITTPPLDFPFTFHRDAFTFGSPRLSDEEVDVAFREVNAMIDRWNTEPFHAVQDFHARDFARRIQDGRIRS